MKQNNETQTIGKLIQTSVFKEALNSTKLQSVIKHSTIFSFWEDIVGKKFVKYTKPYALKYSTLYISAKSPVIVQELELYKTVLLKKINSYSMPLGIEIKKLQFNYKNFDSLITEEEQLKEIEDKPIFIDENTLSKIKIDKKTNAEIKRHIEKIAFLNNEQKEKLVNKILTSYKAQIVRASEVDY